MYLQSNLEKSTKENVDAAVKTMEGDMETAVCRSKKMKWLPIDVH